MPTRSYLRPSVLADISIPSLARSYAPLGVLGLGAAATFGANILARRSLSAGGFTEWAYLTSLLSFFFSFSLLGSEQLIVRTLKTRGETSVLPKDAVQLVAASFLGFWVIYALVLDGRMFEYRLGALAFPMLLSAGIIQVAYQIGRAEGRLLGAQTTYNAWKLILPAALACSLAVGEYDDSSIVVGAALLLGCLLGAGPMLRRFKRFAIEHQPSDSRQMYLPFVLSLGTLAILGIVDRTIVERVHQPESFADYVYLATILLTPFNILSSFFGFREAVKYRKVFSATLVRRDTVRVALQSTALVVAWFVLCYATRTLWSAPPASTLWLLLGLTAVIRCAYGVLSAAMGVRGSPREMLLANGVSMVGVAVYVGLGFLFLPSVTVLVAGYLALWLLRAASYYALLATRSNTGQLGTVDVG